MDLPPVASKLDAAIGLTLESAEDGVVTLRLEPGAVGVVEEDERTYLHGGTQVASVVRALGIRSARSATAVGMRMQARFFQGQAKPAFVKSKLKAWPRAPIQCDLAAPPGSGRPHQLSQPSGLSRA
jgi:hypothetical protein